MAGPELCAICHKRRASVLISQIDQNGNQTSKSICLSCASKMGLPQVKDFMNRMGVSEDDLEQISDEVDSIMENVENGDTSQVDEMIEQAKEMLENRESADSTEDTSEDSSGDDSKEESSDDKNDDGRDSETRKSATGTPNLADFFRNIGFSFEFGRPKAPKAEGDNANSNQSQPQNDKNIKATAKGPKKQEFKFLSMYGINLNKKAEDGTIDTIVGRDRETERIIQILNRRTKNNPALIGEPGVGKTAIAEGLALRIVRGEVPYKLKDKIVIMLDLTAMVAGTQFRGQFEGRMKGVIDEVKKAGNVILVIDELHNIMGAGEAEGSLNAANILKPALSRGEIQVIGATTLNEYRKYIEKDGALERRFQPVMVEEPTVSEAIEILKGIKKHYEEYHFVRYSDDIIEAAVKLAERYITDRFLPDKAIDVIDEAASRANLRNNVPKELEEKKAQLEAAKAGLETIENEGVAVQTEVVKTEPVPKVAGDDEIGNHDQSADPAINISPEEAARIEMFRKIADQKSKIAKLNEEIAYLEEHKYVDIIYDDVAKVIEVWTGIPVKMITTEEAQKLLSLEEILKQRIVGQDKAVESVSKTIRRNRSGFRKRFKPSSFIFAGPTGVGKTELVKQLTIQLFGSEESLIRLDMSEYMEKHTVSKLIGSPPGYVGYDEAGQLTEKVRRHPYSVILFDEIEKAHPDVFNMLLQILDDGRLTDSQGRVVNFENTIIILTTNAYGRNAKGALGFGAVDESTKREDDAMLALKKVFRPEFLNRIDEIIVFNSLSKDAIRSIVKIMLKEVEMQCQSRDIKLEITDSAINLIAENGFEEEYGARPIRRYIQKNIEDELAEFALRGMLKKGTITIDCDDDKLKIILP